MINHDGCVWLLAALACAMVLAYAAVIIHHRLLIEELKRLCDIKQSQIEERDGLIDNLIEIIDRNPKNMKNQEDEAWRASRSRPRSEGCRTGISGGIRLKMPR
jgi:hypothetical protein